MCRNDTHFKCLNSDLVKTLSLSPRLEDILQLLVLNLSPGTLVTRYLAVDR